MIAHLECPGGTNRTNPYRVGSLLWVERRRYLAVRALLDELIDRRVTFSEAADDLWALETDTLAAFVPPGHSSELDEAPF